MVKVKYTKELMEEACKNAKSIAQVCRNIGLKPVGGNYRTILKKISEYNIDISHFTGLTWNKGLKYLSETALIPLDEILQQNVSYKSNTLKKRLIAEGYKENKCEVCGYSENLELHHINGDHYDNRLENLQILCPNCHAKTDNFRGRNSKRTQEGEKLSKDYKLAHYCTCMNCNKEFYSARTDKTRKFCGRLCYTEYLRKIQQGIVAPLLDNSNLEAVSLLSKESILEEIQNHSDITSLAKVFNVSRPTMRKYLLEYGLYEDFKFKYNFHSKAVLQYDLVGNLIKEWPSISDASETLNIDTSHISKCCKFKRHSAGGFRWKYKET